MQRIIDSIEVNIKTIEPRPIVLAMDTTYWGRTEGLMVFRDVIRAQNLLWYWCGTETNSKYIEGIKELQDMGFTIRGVVIDGRRWLAFRIKELGIPVQICQFHQIKTVKKYLTSRPKLQPSKELLALAKMLPRTDKQSFRYWLSKWHRSWKTFLEEKTPDEDNPGKSRYTHQRLRSAYFSLNHNLDRLFVYYTVPGMPNTTNSIDGYFSQLKSKLGVHQGLRKDRRRKLTEELLQTKTTTNVN